MSAARVVLLRHGRTAANAERRFQGQRDTPLDEVGRAQALRAADLLADELRDAGPVRMVSSDLSRAWDTAAPLAKLLDVEPLSDQRLREVYAGEWEGLTHDQITERWAGDFAAWRRGDDIRVGGGETRTEAASRCAASIVEHDATMDGGTLVCVSHGGALRGAVFVLLGWGTQSWNAFEALGNAHWARLTHSFERGWRLGGYNLG